MLVGFSRFSLVLVPVSCCFNNILLFVARNKIIKIMRDPNILEIDGSAMEGGGQILRISISLSAILGIPVRIIKIRAGRSKPGLARQHLTGIQLVAQMCGAKLQGASLGSTEVEFSPNKLKGGHYSFDVQTAGSVSLLLQVALPCALLADAPTTLDLIGGTNADMAPQIDYMSSIFKHQLNKFGADFDLTVMRRGFFPKGGGRVQTSIKPVRVLKAVDITNRGEVTSIYGTSAVAGNLPLHLARQSSEGAKSELRSEGEVFIEVIKEERNYAPDNGHFIQLQCETSCGCLLGADALGGPRKEAGEVGRAAGRALRDVLHSGACLDLHAQDQVILYMALAEGRSAVRVGHLTLHTQTAIYIAEMIANVKFEIREDGAQNVIECTGLGFINKSVQSS